MAKGIISEIEVIEDGQSKGYAAECPENERPHQFLDWLLQRLVSSDRGSRTLRIPGTTLSIDRFNVSSITLTIGW